jgi:hypothetical protein
MKITADTATTLRAIVRWTTGAVVATAITGGACYFFPLTSSFAALGLTGCLSLFIGLNIALPPLNPEEDWVPIRASMEEPVEEAEPATKAAAKVDEKPSRTEPVPSLEVLPVHLRRAHGVPTGSWHLKRPGLKHDEEAHKITLSHRPGTRQHRVQFPTRKKG